MLKLPGYLTGFGSKADGSARLSFSTQELQPQDWAAIQGHHNLFGTILFKENDIQDEEIPKEDALEGKKTPSRRQRAIIYKVWEQEGKKGDFEAYYRVYMEKIADWLKTKLNPL